jgi:hypothetical protein
MGKRIDFNDIKIGERFIVYDNLVGFRHMYIYTKISPFLIEDKIVDIAVQSSTYGKIRYKNHEQMISSNFLFETIDA